MISTVVNMMIMVYNVLDDYAVFNDDWEGL